MTTRICPRCQQRYIISEGTGETDFVHECNSGSKVLDEEDVKKKGDWSDYTGSGTVQLANLQGTENSLWGTRGWIEGEDDEELSRRGKSKSLFRQRAHEEFIKLQGGGC